MTQPPAECAIPLVLAQASRSTIQLLRRKRMNDHDQDLSRAFDSQAPKFERAPVQSDPVAIERLVREAGLPPGGLVLDAGCGPGLVAAAFLEAGFRLVGVDLSAEMIARARETM